MPHNSVIDRIWNKVPHTSLTLGSSQRSAHMASHVGKSYA